VTSSLNLNNDLNLSILLNSLSPEAKIEYAKRRAAYLVAQRTAMDHSLPASEWIQRYFYVPELRGPMWLAPYQVAVLDEALSTNAETGLFKYSTIVWSDIKKSIKSCIAASVGLWMAYRNEWASIYAIANDLKGADSRVGYYMRRAIELNKAMSLTTERRGYRINVLGNHSFIESIPIDPTGEAGSNADMVIFSELWGAHHEGQVHMWTEMTTPPNKFGKSFRWVETYAGYSGESLLLEQLYNIGVRHGQKLDLGIPGLEVYSQPQARMLVLWNTVPRLPWQTPEYYAEQEATLPPNEFRRIHKNEWVSSTEKFVPEEWWEACHYKAQGMDALPTRRDKQPVIVGIDAGVSNDHFGIVAVYRVGDKVVPFYVNEWIPPTNAKIDFRFPEAEIRRLAKTYNVVEFAYDEFQLHDMTTRLRRDGVGYFKPFSQNAGGAHNPGRPIADKMLYDLIQQRRIIHDGNSVLTNHINNANAQLEGARAERLLLVKRSPLLKIDCAVALSMASCEALRLNIG
jgi:phage terminase large subunit-like protein